MSKKSMRILSAISVVVFALFFVVYNVSLFMIAGFVHGATFWTSYAMMIVAFITAGITFLITILGKSEPKDAILKMPIFIHSIAYFLIELIVSSVFMVLGYSMPLWFVGLPIQLIIFVVHIAILCSSFFVKGHIIAVDNNIKDKTNFIRLLKVDVDLIAENAVDPEVHQAFVSLSEQVRYSDPMSHESLFELEKQILECLAFAKRCVEQGKNEAALKNCEIASRMLFERNEKTKVLK